MANQSNKIVLITGVSSGFGKQTAEFLANNGYIVYGTIRKPTSLQKDIHPIKIDVTQPESVQQAVKTILEKEGRIDVLINNAGMGISGAIEESSPEEINLQMSTNFMGIVHTIQAVLPSMRKRRSGLIINIASMGGLIGLPYQGFYSASKFAIVGLTESLQYELKPFNIHCVTVNPGDFHTQFTANRMSIQKSHNESAYTDSFSRTITVIEHDENNGLHPLILSRKINAIIQSKHPKPVYNIARWDQKMALVLYRIIPRKYFYSIMKKHYQV